MEGLLFLGGFLVIWILVQYIILPKLGVPT